MSDWCGMLDFYGIIDDELWVLDWKTSAKLYRETRIQTAGYRWAIEGEGHLVHKHGALRLDKEDGTYEFKDYSKFYKQDANEFLLCKELYLVRHPRIVKQLQGGESGT
jgi:hypothetical protein